MGRGKSQRSLELIEVAKDILVVIQPTTVRSVCYQLFARGLIGSMAKGETNRVSTQLRDAREEEIIPWTWIVDETRETEWAPTWRDPEEFKENARRSYRRDRWEGQDEHVEIWSEKGTVRGTLARILNDYGVNFRVSHGFGSATSVKEAALQSSRDSHPWRVLYIGDWDPSGLFISEVDLPKRLERYGGKITLERIALTQDDVANGGLRSFPADTKTGDTRYHWFVERYGSRCWELDAMDPNDLRARVKDAIEACIEPASWARYDLGEQAEQRSLAIVLDQWAAISGQASKYEAGR